jgi:HEAT repeat protein
MKFEKGQPNPGFKRGQSGNPGGRPRMAVDVRELARAHTKAALATLVDCMKNEDGAVRVAAARVILDRGWGRPIQSIEADVKMSAQPNAIASTLTKQEKIAALRAARAARDTALTSVAI